MEQPNENPTNPLHQNFHAQAETLSFKANSKNQENLENSHKKLKQTAGPCMECGGDHWMKDCPHRQVPVITEPMETKVQMGPCIECGEEHWRKDCPHRNPPVVKIAETNIPFLPIERYCKECYLEHLPRHCDLRSRDDKGKGKISLENMEKLPTPNTSEAEKESIPLRVVTRAQAKKNVQIEIDEGTKELADKNVQEDTPSSSKRKGNDLEVDMARSLQSQRVLKKTTLFRKSRHEP